MNEEKPVNIDKEIRKNYRKHFLAKTSIVSFLALFVAASLILAYFVPFTLILTIPFLILPLLLGFMLENMAVNAIQPSFKRMFIGYKMYFSTNFYGVFRIAHGFIKTLLVYLISSTIMMVILHFSIGMNDSSYAQLFNAIMNRENIEVLEQNLWNLLENPTYILISDISEIVSVGLASYMMIHHILTHSFKAFYNLLDKKFTNMAIVNILHRKTFPRIRKNFYLNYYSSFWYMALIYIACFVGGSLLGLLVFNRLGIESGFIGVFVGTIVSMFFLPIVFDTLQIMFTLYGFEYLKTLLNLQSDPLYGQIVRLSPQERSNIEISIKTMEALLKEDEKDKTKEGDEENNKKQ